MQQDAIQVLTKGPSYTDLYLALIDQLRDTILLAMEAHPEIDRMTDWSDLHAKCWFDLGQLRPTYAQGSAALREAQAIYRTRFLEAAKRCVKCGWPLKERMEDGCVAGNCSERAR